MPQQYQQYQEFQFSEVYHNIDDYAIRSLMFSDNSNMSLYDFAKNIRLYNAIMHYIKSHTLDDTLIVYRGINLPDFVKSKNITQPSFFSTTLDIYHATRFINYFDTRLDPNSKHILMAIVMPKGSSGLYFKRFMLKRKNYGNSDYEHEYILLPNTFTVLYNTVNTKFNNQFIVVTPISNNELKFDLNSDNSVSTKVKDIITCLPFFRSKIFLVLDNTDIPKVKIFSDQMKYIVTNIDPLISFKRLFSEKQKYITEIESYDTIIKNIQICNKVVDETLEDNICFTDKTRLQYSCIDLPKIRNLIVNNNKNFMNSVLKYMTDNGSSWKYMSNIQFNVYYTNTLEHGIAIVSIQENIRMSFVKKILIGDNVYDYYVNLSLV